MNPQGVGVRARLGLSQQFGPHLTLTPRLTLRAFALEHRLADLAQETRDSTRYTQWVESRVWLVGVVHPRKKGDAMAAKHARRTTVGVVLAGLFLVAGLSKVRLRAADEEKNPLQAELLKLNNATTEDLQNAKFRSILKDREKAKKSVAEAAKMMKEAKDEKPFNYNGTLIIGHVAQSLKNYDSRREVLRTPDRARHQAQERQEDRRQLRLAHRTLLRHQAIRRGDRNVREGARYGRAGRSQQCEGHRHHPATDSDQSPAGEDRRGDEHRQEHDRVEHTRG